MYPGRLETVSDYRRAMQWEEEEKHRRFLIAEAEFLASLPLRVHCECCTYHNGDRTIHASTGYTEAPIWQIALVGTTIVHGILTLFAWSSLGYHPLTLLLKCFSN